MALNLWTTAGQPASFNPLPTSAQVIKLDLFKTYILKFKAKSEKGATLRTISWNGVLDHYENVTLKNVFQEYTYTWYESENGDFAIIDANSAGDIIIKDIELVEKPLPRPTINGIDGFLSGKWKIESSARVIDDETLELNATLVYRVSEIEYDNPESGAYSFKCDDISTGYVKVLVRNSAGASLVDSGWLLAKNAYSFTVSPNASKLLIQFSNENNTTGTFTFKRPQLNRGSIAAPYSKKTGGRMVLPVFKADGSVQVNATPKTLVPKKNLAFFNSGTGFPAITDITGVVPAGKYRITFNATSPSNATMRIYSADGFERDFMLSGTSSDYSGELDITKAGKIQMYGLGQAADIVVKDVQVEPGTTATPFEPYELTVPNAAQGLAFDGVRDYLKLPSMTMDAIELDCLIASKQMSSIYSVISSAAGTLNGHASTFDATEYNGTLITSLSSVPKDKRVTLKVTRNVAATNSLYIARYFDGNFYYFTGILYGVKCYLNGEVVAAYDFTNPHAVAGTRVLPQPQNLIPAFTDPRWNLHSEFRVLGPDVGRLEASANNRHSFIEIPAKPNQQYRLDFKHSGTLMVRSMSEDGGQYQYHIYFNKDNIKEFTTPGYTHSLELFFTNSTLGAGTFNIEKPQLCEIPTEAGTVYGAPQQNAKPAKRLLFAKR